jgi:hypothetical protein
MNDYVLFGKMGAGKSTVGELLIAQRPELMLTPLAYELKRLHQEWFPGRGFSRGFLQALGAMAREVDPDVFVNALMRRQEAITRAAALPLDHHDKRRVGFVVDDLRFPNEWWRLREEGFVFIEVLADRQTRIDRLKRIDKLESEDQLEHFSETQLDDRGIYIPDFKIMNNDSTQDLDAQVAHILYEVEKR